MFLKLRHLNMDEPDTVLKAIKSRKAAGLDEIPAEKRKTRKFDDTLLQLCNIVYHQNTIEKGDLGINRNYNNITLTAYTSKIYNTLLLNRIRPEDEKFLWKNQNAFRRNRSITSQILTFRRITEGKRP